MVLEVPEIWNSSKGPSPLEDLSYTSWNSVRENRYMVQRAYISLAKVLNTLAFFPSYNSSAIYYRFWFITRNISSTACRGFPLNRCSFLAMKRTNMGDLVWFSSLLLLWGYAKHVYNPFVVMQCTNPSTRGQSPHFSGRLEKSPQLGLHVTPRPDIVPNS